LTASMKSTLETYIRTHFGIHHMIVKYRTHFNNHFGPGDVDLVRRIPGVEDAAPGYMFVPPADYPIYMGILPADPISAASARIIEGQLPGPGEVALPKGFAQRMKVNIGDEIALPFFPDSAQTVVVTGFTQGISMSARSGVALFDMNWLQQATGEVGRYQAILIALTRPKDVGQARTVASRLEQLFPEADVNPLDELRALRRNMGGMGPWPLPWPPSRSWQLSSSSPVISWCASGIARRNLLHCGRSAPAGRQSCALCSWKPC